MFRMRFSNLRARAMVQWLPGVCLLVWAVPADAHHPFGGETPTTAWAGFLSGLGHPVIGLDHLVFVIAVGLLAALYSRGLSLPVAFVGTTLMGTVLHLLSLDLPAPEVFISLSVLGLGCLLSMERQRSLGLAMGLVALAGLFHGYAYGEAIVGAEPTPLMAYLTGFAMIQLAIALGARVIAQSVLKAPGQILPLRFAGFTICGVGAAFLSAVFLG